MRQAGGTRLGPEPEKAPTTTRIGGGVSARAMAIVAVVVLGAVAWVGFSNRPSAGDPLARPFFPIAAITPGAAASGQPTSRPTAASNPELLYPGYGDPGAPIMLLGRDAMAVIAQIEGRAYLGLLREAETGHFVAAFRAPFLDWREESYALELAQLWTRNERVANYVPLGRWEIDLAPLRPAMTNGITVLLAQSAPQPRQPNVPRAVRLGYTIRVSLENAGTFGVVLIDVVLGPGNQLRGDDGVMGGLPLVGPARDHAPRAEPAVPLILLTAQPWNTQRSTRTHGESWVGGY